MTDDLVRRLNEDFSVNAREDIQHQIKVYEAERKEAADRIEDQQKRNAELKFILVCALADYESSPYPQDMHFDWIENARAALEGKKDDSIRDL